MKKEGSVVIEKTEAMEVKKAKEMKNLKDLNLSPETYEILKEYTPDSLILCARREDLFGALMKARNRNCKDSTSLAKEAIVCKKASDELYRILEEGGYYRTDFEEYKISFNIMTFLRIVLNGCRFNNDYFSDFFNVRREWKRFTNEEYEEFTGLSDRQIEGFLSVLRSALSKREFKYICLRMGLIDGYCKPRKVAAPDLTDREASIMEADIFKKMANIVNREVMEKIYHNFLSTEKQGLVKALG